MRKKHQIMKIIEIFKINQIDEELIIIKEKMQLKYIYILHVQCGLERNF